MPGKLRFAAVQPHIWWGVSVEDKKDGVPRIDDLRRAEPKVGILSIEPLVEDIGVINLAGISWAICGGESGPKAGPIQLSCVTSIRDQCAAAKVPFFFKQWGGVRKGTTGRMLERRAHDEFPARLAGPLTTDAERRALIDELERKYNLNA